MIAEASGKRPPPARLFRNPLAKALLRAPGLGRLTQDPRALLELLTVDVRYDAQHTRLALEGTAVRCPPLESYVAALVRRAQMESAPAAASADSEVYDPL